MPLVRGLSGGLVVKSKLDPTSSVCLRSIKTFILRNFSCYLRDNKLKTTDISDREWLFVVEV